MATMLGFLFAGVAFLGIPVAIAARITGQFVPGVTTTVIAVLMLGGIQLIAVGLIGEYVGRIYDEVKQRPLYFVRERMNLPSDEPAAAERGLTTGPPIHVAAEPEPISTPL
jgi:dolichol-phosphate mannosyltransferase